MSILAVSGSQGARLRGSSGPTGPRGKEIYCQTGGPPRAGIAHSIFCSQMNRSLSRITGVKTEALASDIGDDQLVYIAKARVDRHLQVTDLYISLNRRVII